jgi:hypothetical protein
VLIPIKNLQEIVDSRSADRLASRRFSKTNYFPMEQLTHRAAELLSVDGL